jgi:ATP-dependent DNA helicase DinG
MVVILDPRMKTKPYGRIFLQSLPDCRVIEERA